MADDQQLEARRAYMRDYMRAYRAKNPEKVREHQRRWAEKNPDYDAKRRAANREKYNEYHRRWRERNRDKVRGYNRKHDAKRKAKRGTTNDHGTD